jgi:two-component system chemotaxis sensor kinase CheA
VVVEVSDDGRGIDPDGVRQKAVTRGILDAKRAAELHPEEVVELLFAPGFSTADRVTEISGRGVGLDVVKAHVERLRGKVTVTTRPGEGTTFSLQLPLTLAVMPVFLAEVAGEVLAVPVDRVVALLRIRQEDLAVWGTVLRLPDRVLPLLDLGKRFWGTETAGEYALVVSDEAGEFAFPIAQSLGLRDVVVKRMSRFVGEVSGIAGCAVLGDGRVALVLDPTELSGGERAEGSRRSAPRRAS